MTKRDLALAYFSKGYNCSQAVLLAFARELGLTEGQAARLGASFGGGVARLKDICGAVSAMALVTGLQEGYEDPTDAEAKAVHYERVRALIGEFEAENGSRLCRELLDGHPEPPLEPGQAKPTHNPACYKFVGDAAQIMEAHVRAQSVG